MSDTESKVARLRRTMGRTGWSFTLRAILLVVLAFSLLVGAIARRAHRHRSAVAALQARGCHLMDSGLTSTIEARIGSVFGFRDGSEEIFAVSCPGGPLTDADLADLEPLTELRILDVSGTRMTNRGLISVQRLTHLQSLAIRGTAITDAGLMHLRALSELTEIDLDGVDITDAGLVHLYGLRNLQNIYLQRTRITDAGVRDLNAALPDCTVYK